MYLDSNCNRSLYGVMSNSTLLDDTTTGTGSVGSSSIIALIIFFGLIIYSA